MRERLRSALGELYEAAILLEARVADRTEQLNAAHQKLLHNDRLASLGQLAASVAHEINNPISGVLNLSMLLERIMKEGKVPPGREAECRKYLARISQETSRVGRIVCDLLAFSRRSKPQRSAADLNNLVKTTVSLVGHKLKLNETNVELGPRAGSSVNKMRRIADPAGDPQPGFERGGSHSFAAGGNGLRADAAFY